jgi:hypothetical protein
MTPRLSKVRPGQPLAAQDPQALTFNINIKQLQKKNGKSQVIREENPPGKEKGTSQQVLR